jgi:hypothetical protein
MINVQQFEKKEFIIRECMLASFQAGMQTRNKYIPIYNNVPEAFTTLPEIKYQYDNASNLKLAIFDFLDQYLTEIKREGIRENDHLQKFRI